MSSDDKEMKPPASFEFPKSKKSTSQYLPLSSSLSSDAPGHGGDPICWKCKGNGQRKTRVKATRSSASSSSTIDSCGVCSGRGTMPRKKLKPSGGSAVSTSRPTSIPITVKRSAPSFYSLGPPSYENHGALSPAPDGTTEMSNFVGGWRICQSTKGGHRWTTDDLATAYVASLQSVASLRSPSSFPPADADDDQLQHHTGHQFRHLDLGCGNGSVLFMLRWFFNEDAKWTHTGVEARQEGVRNANITKNFNTNPDECRVNIVRGDFRSVVNAAFDGGKKFHLITGTPPYFEVEFSTNSLADSSRNNSTHSSADSDSRTDQPSTCATIVQGGMPSHLSSAPARCEFRGGIEAYIAAASSVISDEGRFVVCLNWGNESRVQPGADAAGMRVTEIYEFKGGETKPTLFGVFVLEKKKRKKERENGPPAPIPKTITVRNKDGSHNEYYARNVLDRFRIHNEFSPKE